MWKAGEIRRSRSQNCVGGLMNCSVFRGRLPERGESA